MIHNAKFLEHRIKFSILIAIAVLLFSAISLLSEVLESQDLLITYHKDDKEIAEKISSRFSEMTEVVNRKVGIYPDISGKINLILSHNKTEYHQYIKRFKVVPEESEAFAVPQKALIIIHNPKDMQMNSNFFQVLIHEYNHILLHSIVTQVFIPLWFDEGFAQYFAGQWDIKKEFFFVTNALQGNLVKLSHYNYHYPEFENEREFFYLQSYYTMKYLINRFSKERFQDFLEALQISKDFGQTFFVVFKIPLSQFLLDAEKSIKSHTILTIFYSGFGLLWTIIPILLIIAYARKRLLGKRVKEIWDREENSDKDFPSKENRL